uniref:Uncharacterized protein n=1 Tax=Anopheles farauti TaxID=69004 RepID=A0A182QLJ2_9DIPT
MADKGFSSILTSGCFNAGKDSSTVKIPHHRSYSRQREPSQSNEPKIFPLYECRSGGDVRQILPEYAECARRFETATSNDGEMFIDQYKKNDDGRHISQQMIYDPLDANAYNRSRGGQIAPGLQLKVAHQKQISIRPRNKNPQIVNVCQTFRFPDNFITQNNTNRMVYPQERLLQHPLPVSESRRVPQSELSPCRSNSRARLGGFFGGYRRHRNMFSQTSRTLIQLVEGEQMQQQQSARPAAVPRKMLHYNESSIISSSESEISFGEPDDVHPCFPERKSKMPYIKNDRITAKVPCFDRTKRSITKIVDARAPMGGYYGRNTNLQPAVDGNARFSRHQVKAKPDHRKVFGEKSAYSPFMDELFTGTKGHTREALMTEKVDSTDHVDRLDLDADEIDNDPLEKDVCLEQDDFDEDIDEEVLEEDNNEAPSAADTGRGVVAKETSVSISGIVDKLQDNVWEVCLEGVWDLMDMAERIDWKAQEKYITVINRKLIEFLKSPRTALCRSACQVSGELFRQAKSTKRPEFDEMVDILLCKTADPNRFIQKDANVALDKLVTYIPTPHTVRALSNRGTIHRNPLVRTATARLLVCVCVVAGLDAILGTTANTRTRKIILSMLAKFLTDKNLETRKFGERLYRMLRKHKFFDEYFYKDMDSNLRTNLKRVLKGI